MSNEIYYRTYKILGMDRGNAETEKQYPERFIIHNLFRQRLNAKAELIDNDILINKESKKIKSNFRIISEAFAVFAVSFLVMYIIDFAVSK